MNKTNIEWVKNPDGSQGYTWNPMTGCLNHANGLCNGGGFPCYAYKLAHGRLKERYTHGGQEAPGIPKDTKVLPSDPFYPRFWEDRMQDVNPYPFCNSDLRTDKPKGIFVCDMGDLFGMGIPEEWIREILNYIERCPQHRFYLLTKQPQNLIKLSPFPENCWVGVTATSQQPLAVALHHLFDIQAKVRFISLEPLLGKLDFWKGSDFAGIGLPCEWQRIDWLIIGACTGQDHWELEAFNYHHDNKLQLRKWGKRWTLQPKIEWVSEIIEAADKAGIPVFLKDNLNPIFAENDCAAFNQYKDQLFTIIDNFPTRYHLRQEMPKL